MKKKTTVLVMTMVVLTAAGCGPKEQSSQPEAKEKLLDSSVQPAGLEGPVGTCTVLINEARNIRLSPDAPLFVQAVVFLPPDLPERELETDGPCIIDRKGNAANAGWTELQNPEKRLQPGKTRIFGWQAKSVPGPGIYKVKVDIPGMDMDYGRLEIAEGATDEKQNQRFARRLKALKGETGELIEELKEMIAGEPQRLSLRIELADVLESTGDYEGAEKQLIEYGYRLQQRMGDKWVMPDWLAFRLSGLMEKKRGAGKQN